MALQIWLPLNGDLTNYGLCQDVIITGNDSYQNSIGKIGEYALNSIDTITVQAPAFNNLTSWSVCFWANAIPSLLPNEDDDAATIIKIPSVNNHVFSPTIKAYQEQYSGETYGTYTIDGIGEATGIEYFAGWRHICLTFDGNRCYSYCDGRNWGSGWSSDNRKISAGIFELRSNNIVLKNDFRFYDHCLSEKEIKEISKALVLHYPMNNKYIEATRNLFPSTDSYSVADDLGWDQTLNQTPAYCPSGWSWGYNSGVSSSSIGYHAQWVMEDSKLIMKFPNLNSSVGKPNRWLGISAPISLSNLPSGTKYTVSFDMKSTDVNAGITGGIYYKLTSSDTSRTFHDGNLRMGINTVANEWQHFSYTFTRAAGFNATNNTAGSFYFYSSYTAEAITYVKNMQLEINDHETVYVPGGSTRPAVGKEIDCGVANIYDGNIVGTIKVTADTPRYSYSYNFTSGSYIGLESIPITAATKNCTFSFWMKTPNPSNTMCIWNGRASMGGPISIFDIGNYFRFDDGAQHTFSSYQIPTNEWHHYSFTRDASTIKLYVDGELKSSMTATDFTTIGTKATIGASSTNTATGNGNNFVGNLSDYRIYATTLSAEDIKELYHTAAWVDKDIMAAYEFKEV